MKHKKRRAGSRMLSIVLAMVLMVSGITVPVQADTLPAAEESTAYEQQAENVESTEHYQESENQESEIQEPEEAVQPEAGETEQISVPEMMPGEAETTEDQAAEEKPYVYFQYDDGRIQEMDENNTFTLNAMDEGTFVLAGTDKRPDWNVSAKVYTSDIEYTEHYWVNASGRYQPADLRVVEGYVCNADNMGEVFQRFKINNVSSNVEELKVFVGDQEVSLDKPYEMHGTDSGVAYLKARVKGSDEFKKVPVAAMYHENISGPGIIQNHAEGSKFTMESEGEAVFKLGMGEDKQRLSKEFKVISKNVALEDFQVTVPSVWYIDSWNPLGGYYVGITKGNDPDDYNCSFTPYNATNQKLVWEAKTPEIAEFMEYFGNGIVPKKAGVAKFHIYSQEDKDISQDISVEFKYKYPLQKAESEKDTYELEEGSSKSVQITPTPSNATEQRFNWSYSKEGIVEVTDEVQTVVGNVNAPRKTVHTIKAKKAGEVQVIGTPWDATADCKPVQFTVLVSKGGIVPDDTDYTALVKEDIQHGMDYLQKEPVNAYGDEWNIFTTLRAGGTISQENLDAYYASVSEKLKTGLTKLRATDVARVSITLAAMGKDLTDIDGVNLMKALYNDELKMKIGKDTSNAPIWALIALDCQNADIPKDAVWTREKLIQHILTFQTQEGGFGLTNNKFSSIDMTGMALQALAPYRNNDSYPEVKTAFDKALEHMKENMTENAGFLDSGKENSCTTAQVLTALTAAGIDPLDKSNGFTKTGNKNIVKNLDSYKAESGFMWQQGQKGNGMATQQVTYAMEAYRRFAENENRLYDLTDVMDKDTAAVKSVIKQIDAIGEVTLESEAAIKAARTAYDKLTEAQKKLVTNYGKLTEAEEKLAELKEQAADQKAADAVIEKIKAIGEVTLESKNDIEEARAAYDKLTDSQKKLISEDVLKLLEKAEEDLKKLEEEAGNGHVVVSVERFTIGQGYIHEPVIVPFEKGDNAVDILKKVIGAENWVGEDGSAAYLEAIKGADLGSDHVKVPDYISEKLGGPTTEEALENGKSQEGDALGEFDYSFMSGWMYHVNGVEVGYGMASYVPKDGDVLRYQFTLWGYGTDLTGYEYGNLDPVLDICNKDEITRVMAEVNEDRDMLMAVPAVKAAYDKAVELVSAVITPKAEIETATENLKKAMEEAKEQMSQDKLAAESVIAKINAIGEVTLESEAVITEARTAYDKLTDAQKELVGTENLAKLTDAEKKLAELKQQAEEDQKVANAVIEKINAIGEVTLESEAAITEARAAYDKLTEAQKKFISETELKTLKAAEAKLKVLKQQAAADQEKANAVIEKINAIGEVTLESEKAITETRTAYNALTDAQKNLVGEDNLAKLTTAEKKLAELKEQAADQKAADAVIEKIKAIGEVTLESKNDIEEARAAYDKLTDSQKKLISEDVLKLLEKAEEDLKKLEEEAGNGHVVVSVERFTIGQGYIHEPVIVPFEKGDNAVDILKKVIGAENWVGEDGSAAYLEAIKGADLGSDHVKVPDYISEKLGGPTTEEALENGKSQEGDALGEFDYSFMSGWMYHVNGVEVGYGMASYVPKDGDVLRYQFTLWGYGTDLTGYEYGNLDPVLDICNKDEITRVMAEVNEDRDMLMAVPAVKAAYDKAVELVSAVITPKAEIETATENLKKAMEEAKEQMSQDKLAAESVIAKINAIGEVTLESEAVITEARTAYDKLTDAQKELVGTENLAKLTDAEKKLAELKQQAEEDQKVANAVIEKINAIGEVTLESEAAITEARAAYDKLTEAQKKFISETELKTLKAAEAKLKVLKQQAAADQEKANAVIEKINAIGEVTLESEKAITETRTAYNALTDAQKNLVGEDNLAKLTTAEKKLAELKEQAENQKKDQAAADAAAGKIDAIGDKITLESKAAIEAARKAYDALTDAQKKLVSKETLAKLEKAEEELKKLEDNNQNPNPNPGKPESVKMLVNEKYGVKLEGEGLTSDMELAVTPIGKDNADVEKMRKEIASDKSVFRLYNIKLTKNGKEIELPSACVLSIPVGKDYNGKELTVLHCSDSKVEKLTGKVTDEAVSVEVKSLDSFGVVIDTPASNGNNGSGNHGNNGSNGSGNNGSGNSGSGTLKGTGAKTGDEAPISVLLLMLAVSAAAFGTAVYKKNRQQMK